jgi:hypothetical protein
LLGVSAFSHRRWQSPVPKKDLMPMASLIEYKLRLSAGSLRFIPGFGQFLCDILQCCSTFRLPGSFYLSRERFLQLDASFVSFLVVHERPVRPIRLIVLIQPNSCQK